jgi:HEAT repeats/Calcineurin-like phosphoesterase
MRKLIIGDIHGCYDELTRLVEKACLDRDDEIIALGDIVDRGPDTMRVIDFFNYRTHARSIMGNHEHKHILSSDRVIQPDPAQQITFDQFTPWGWYGKFIDTIRSYPLYLDMPEALLIHGAFEPGVPITNQKKNVLLGTRNGEAYLRKHYDKPWYELYDGEKPIIAGHRDYSGKGEPLVVGDRIFLMDSGCCYGKYLSAVLLPGFQIIRVKSRKNYWGVIKQRFMSGEYTRNPLNNPPSKTLRNILKKKAIFREDDPVSLLEALGDVEPHIRRAAADALKLTGDHRWTALIKGDVEDFDRLGFSDLPQAVTALIYALGWREWDVRASATARLGNINVPETVGQLGRALHHQNHRIRTGAVEALGIRGEPESTDLLIEALEHSDPEVVTEALEMLEDSHNPRLLPALESLWDRSPMGVSMDAVKKIYRKWDGDKHG